MRRWTYPSQCTLRPHGGTICTPTALLVATAHVRGTLRGGVPEGLTPAVVAGMMASAHDLVAECFAARPAGSGCVMADELRRFLPREDVAVSDAAGLLLERSDDGPPGEVEGLRLTPLAALLGDLRRAGARAGALVTTGGHTVCYLFDERGRAFVFDSLVAELVELAPSCRGLEADLAQRYGGRAAEEYCALVLHARPRATRRGCV